MTGEIVSNEDDGKSLEMGMIFVTVLMITYCYMLDEEKILEEVIKETEEMSLEEEEEEEEPQPLEGSAHFNL